MRPGREGPGTAALRPRRPLVRAGASMRPGREGPGTGQIWTRFMSWRSSFNEARARRPGKALLSAGCRYVAATAFKGPGAKARECAATPGVRRPSSPGFNEREARGMSRTDGAGQPVPGASIRPGREGPRNSWWPTSPRRLSRRGFNEAQARRPGTGGAQGADGWRRLRASMRPGREGPGMCSYRLGSIMRRSSFNEARARRPGNGG